MNRNRLPDHPRQDRPQQGSPRERRFLASPFGWALCTFLLVAGVLLSIEHRAHILGVLPLLLPLLICIGMHFFMHRGHGGHGGRGRDDR
ncbi:MAG: DUF2933 domain-containing protein [Kiloniellales bacterium]